MSHSGLVGVGFLVGDQLFKQFVARLVLSDLRGVQRIAKFTKYLREFGWQSTVVTVGNVGYFAYDYSLLDEVLEAEVIIEQTDTIDPLKFFKRNKNKPVEMPPDRQRRFAYWIVFIL